MTHFSHRVGVVLLIAAAVIGSGCSGSGGGGGGGKKNTLSGTAVDGRVSNGLGKVFTLATSGMRTEVGTIATDARGDFTVTLPANLTGPVLLELTSGQYTDGATGQPRSLTATDRLAAVTVASGGPLTVFLTPLTTIAAALLDPTAFADEAALAAGIVLLNEAVAEAFGLVDGNGDPVDVTTIMPLDLTDGDDAQAYAADPGSLEAEAGRIVGGLAEVAEAAGPSTPALTAALGQDAADGVFDGRDAAGNPIAGLGASSVTDDLARGIEDFLRETHVVQTFQAEGLPAPDPQAAPVQQQQAGLAASGGEIGVPADPIAPTPTGIQVLGLTPAGFVNAATNENAIAVNVALGPDALAGDGIQLTTTDVTGAGSLQLFTLVSAGAQSVPFTVDTNARAEGEIRFVARLQRGSSTSLGVAATIVKDETNPTGTITAPNAGSTVSGAMVAVAAAAQDDSGVASVQLTIRDSNNVAVSATASAPPFAATLDVRSLASGNGTLTITVTDRAGNVRSNADTRSVIIDNVGTGIWDTSNWDGALWGQ